MDKKKFLYYFAYGSNLLSERFKVYVEGGSFRSITNQRGGCSDHSFYFSQKPIPHISNNLRLFFGNNSGTWQGAGVAFVEEQDGEIVLGRLYKVTEEQFLEIQVLEGTSSRWYGRIINETHLGFHEGLPIKTITCDKGINKENPPSETYLKVIREGLIETGYPEKEINDYLCNRTI